MNPQEQINQYTPTISPNNSVQNYNIAAPTPPNNQVVNQSNPNSTQNSLEIAEIRDGIVIMNDGSFRSVIMVKSINFDLMSQEEQEAVEFAYQGFLNSLYFPIQIFIHSQKIDLKPYIDKLDKIRLEHDNMLLANLMGSYLDYVEGISNQINLMDKLFYIVVPYFPLENISVQKAFSQSVNLFSGLIKLFSKNPDNKITINDQELQKAKTELKNRVQAVVGGLMQCNIQSIPLDTQELIELYYDIYNPDTSTRQQLISFDNLTTDIVSKGSGNTVQPHLQRELEN